MTIPFCPDSFLDNCKNFPFKCKSCRGFSGSPIDPLFYQPRDLTISRHPAKLIKKNSSSTPVDKSKSRQIKQGFKQEDKIVKKTIRSGALFGDGDLFVPFAELKIDSKLRHTSSLSFSLRKDEYLKGIQQGVECWAITNQPPSSPSTTVYILTEQAFLSLLHLAKLNSSL